MKNTRFISRFIFSVMVMILSAQTVDSSHNQFDSNNAQLIIGATAIASATTYAGYLYAHQTKDPVIQVKDASQENLHFPENFTWGVCTSSTQSEESSNNHGWSQKYLDAIDKTDTQTPKHCCNSFENWQDDIDKVIHLGCTSYRCSIEWSRVQPTENSFDVQAIDHYVQVVKYCKNHNLDVMICLHHYSDPIWFLEKGGFAQANNIRDFVKYCNLMYHSLSLYVDQWIVISQPTSYALKGYKVGIQSPFLKNSGLENIVMLHLFKAHIAVYDMMHYSYKTTPMGQKKPEVGICHQIVQMQAYNWYNPFERLVATFADRLSNQSFLRFFTDGHFQSLLPIIDIAYDSQAPDKFDFFALSYYSPLAFSYTTPVAPQCSESLCTHNSFRIIDKDGMYDAIKQASALGKPVYVVENGINPKNEAQRKLLLNSYLSAISQAIHDGYDVRGYMHWTLMDNYEWGYATGGQNSTAFGLYNNRVIDDATGQLHPDFDNHDAMLKESGLHYKNIIKTQR